MDSDSFQVLSIRILSGEQAGREVTLRRFPSTIGRSRDDTIRVTDPGVWDRHLTISLSSGRKFLVASRDGSNGPPRELKNGEILDLTGMKARAALSDVPPPASPWRERFVWMGVGAMALFQIAIIYVLTAL